MRKTHRCVIVLSVLAIVICSHSSAQLSQQGDKLVGIGRTGQGNSAYPF
jgi:hypothetical protein